MKKQWRTIIALFIVIIIAIFSVLNVKEVSINFWFTQIRMPMILILLLSIFAGALLIGLLTTSATLKLKKDNTDLNQQVAEWNKNFDKTLADKTEKMKSNHRKEVQLLQNEIKTLNAENKNHK
ncbi:LapA family protein [Dellaglioa carnosa]|uniref:LapA family protein n=1 Tax=Dellaglioa carnosa TaxID=2995136 RepID=A0ABT4JKC8_9LACO|nr:LapA family protein [Dellaglioa carnosa]MCZ2490825.1 LapA family protein [Dellaglioa carnosa]MCZ2492466.1 LapA family protein [Dellaglioa carnosa]MCZ2493903.1 LapA family protein [Dellaglioa carnosa]MDK1730767.1 LapA family protein [Dellaglioa carnosa]